MKQDLELFSFFYGYPCNYITEKEYEISEYVILGHFTTSNFLDSILSDGLKAPVHTNYFSNKDLFIDGDEYYVYFTAHFDTVFAKNAVKKFGGKEILILVKVKKDTLELDNLMNIYTNKGISLTCKKTLYKALVHAENMMCQCRTKSKILSEQIIEILDVDKVINRRINDEIFLNRSSLTFSELKKDINIELLRYQKNSLI